MSPQARRRPPERPAPSGRAAELHRRTTIVLSTAMVLIGLALIIRTLVSGGGGVAIGLLLGVLFVAAGAGRIYLARRPRS